MRTRMPGGKKGPSKELAEAIMRTRIHVGLSQSDMAKKFGKNIATVGRWERAQRLPHSSMIAELMLMAPDRDRYIFEDHLGKTFDQVLREKFSTVPQGPPEVERWEAEPIKYAARMAGFIHARVVQITAEARSNDPLAANCLLAIAKLTLK